MNLKKIKYLFIAIFLAINFQISSFSAEKEINCIAVAVFKEARGESIKGQEAVAQVIMNRTKHEAFPNTPCKVVLARNQFSWTIGGLDNASRSLLKGSTRGLNDKEVSAYQEARQIALRAFYGLSEYNARVASSLFFVHKNISPSWTHKLKKDATIGNHKFFSERK